MRMVVRSSGCDGMVIVKDAPCSGVRKVKGGVELQRGEHRGEYSLERWSAQSWVFLEAWWLWSCAAVVLLIRLRAPVLQSSKEYDRAALGVAKGPFSFMIHFRSKVDHKWEVKLGDISDKIQNSGHWFPYLLSVIFSLLALRVSRTVVQYNTTLQLD